MRKSVNQVLAKNSLTNNNDKKKIQIRIPLMLASGVCKRFPMANLCPR